MPRNSSKNTSNFHYRVEKLDDDNNIIEMKRYYTLTDICNNFDLQISVYKIRQNARNNKTIKGFENYKFHNEIYPAFKRIPNI